MPLSVVIVALLALCAQPALACEGCRVQGSPSFIYAGFAALAGGLLYIGLWLAGQRVRAGLFAATCLAGFLTVFSCESALWTLADRGAISHELMNRFHAPTMFLAWSALAFATAGLAGVRAMGLHPELELRLTHPLWLFCPVAGLPAFVAIGWLAPATTGADAGVAGAVVLALAAMLVALPVVVCRREPALAPIAPGAPAVLALAAVYAIGLALFTARSLARVPGTSAQVLATRPESAYADHAALAPDGRSAYACTSDAMLVWSLPDGALLMRKPHVALRPIALSADRALVAALSDNFTPSLVGLADGRSWSSPSPHDRPLECAAFSADGKTVAFGAWYGTAFALNCLNGHELARVHPSGFHVSAVALSSDGRLLATASEDRAVRLFEVPGGRAVRGELTIPARVMSLAFSPDGRRLAAVARNQDVLVWDVESGSQLHALDLTEHRFVTSVGFAPDGQLLGVSSDLVANGRFRLGVWRLLGDRE